MPRLRSIPSGFRRGGTPRRQTLWGSGQNTTTAVTVLAANSVQLDQALTEASLTEATPGTIVRTRGSLWVQSDQSAAIEAPFGAMGFSVVKEQARAIGVTALPAPSANANTEDWFVHLNWAQSILFKDASGVQVNTFERYDFDSKAMRKILPGEAIVVMIDNRSVAFGAEYILSFRILFKLH